MNKFSRVSVLRMQGEGITTGSEQQSGILRELSRPVAPARCRDIAQREEPECKETQPYGVASVDFPR